MESTLGLDGALDVQDFFARFDPAFDQELNTYLTRAEDPLDVPTHIEMDSRAYLIALRVLCIFRKLAGVPKPSCERLLRPAVRRALGCVEDHLDEPLRLSDLADVVGLSPFHFTRLFRQEVGTAPAECLMQRRVERAREMVRRTSLSLAEIALRTGFSSQSHMTRRFKLTLGVTPGSLRRS